MWYSICGFYVVVEEKKNAQNYRKILVVLVRVYTYTVY